MHVVLRDLANTVFTAYVCVIRFSSNFAWSQGESAEDGLRIKEKLGVTRNVTKLRRPWRDGE